MYLKFACLRIVGPGEGKRWKRVSGFRLLITVTIPESLWVTSVPDLKLASERRSSVSLPTG